MARRQQIFLFVLAVLLTSSGPVRAEEDCPPLQKLMVGEKPDVEVGPAAFESAIKRFNSVPSSADIVTVTPSSSGIVIVSLQAKDNECWLTKATKDEFLARSATRAAGIRADCDGPLAKICRSEGLETYAEKKLRADDALATAKAAAATFADKYPICSETRAHQTKKSRGRKSPARKSAK